MKRVLGVFIAAVALFAANQPATVCAETETIDLKALAKKARPAVMLLVVSDANGKEIATGTGFLVSSDGKLITNFHVIEKAASAVAKAENGGMFPVEGVLASDPKNDLVLLKLRAKDQPFLTLGKSENIEVGTRIAVIGSPLGLEGTLSEGIVSAVRELMGDMKVLQITAAISPGSSGSPVMNAKGEVIGVTRFLLLGGQALNFAVPVIPTRAVLKKAQKVSVASPLASLIIDDHDKVFTDPNYLAALAADDAQDYVSMLKKAQTLARQYPENVDALIMLGAAYVRLNSYSDATVSFRKAIKLKPDDGLAWYNLGECYREDGRVDDAIMAYKQAIKLQPNDAGTWTGLGLAYAKVLRLNDAVAAHLQAVRFKPDYAGAWNNLGIAYGKSGRTVDAIAALRQAVTLKPNLADTWYNLGVAYRQLGRADEAASAFAQARKLNPSLFKK